MQKKLVFLLIPLLAVTLWGCGSNRDSDSSSSSPSTPAVAIEDAGLTGNCTVCHTVGVHTQFSAVAGNNTDALGQGTAISHDCEDCHGGGQYHHGDGPLPYAAPGMTRCEACHTQATKVIASNHAAFGHESTGCNRCHTAEGYFQFAKVVAPGATMPSIGAVTPENGPICGACHNPVTGGLRTTPNWDPNANGVADQLDLCTSCHQTEPTWQHRNNWDRSIASTHIDDPATASGTGGATTSPIEGYVIRADSANPCFDCHGHELKTHTGNVGRTYFAGTDANGVQYTAEDRKYYAYLKDPNHESTIHADWAQSAHAGGLLKAKYAAQEAYPKISKADGQGNVYAAEAYDAGTPGMMSSVKVAGVTDSPIGNAWAHYDWDNSTGNPRNTVFPVGHAREGYDNVDRKDCQHCHTATGAANFLTAAAAGKAYVAADNDFSHLAGWTAEKSSAQQEVLYCWSCHSSVETGALHATGAIKLDYLVNGAAKTLTPPDGNSAACISCHSGRGNAEAITGSNTVADPTAAAVSSPGTKSHYFAAGLTINQAAVNAGYTFGLSYTDKPYFAHNKLGCAECHMTSENSHSFAVVAKDETTGDITRIVSSKCVECHDGEHALFVADSQIGTVANIWNGTAAVPTTVTQAMVDAAAAEMEHEAHGFHQALEALGAYLTAAGTPPQSNYPYFSGTPANQGHSGAMYNYSYLHHEPGAYAHNRFLAKRLIWDSIDWMDDGILNNSVDIATTYPDAAAWLGTSRP